ncbi:hypothetical protein ABW20_dc0100534 [Dactylellina cionopaga]|nr:hypothetical protein ABW20_dc0100534 [Dactylellina cionopaga]
MAISRVIKKEAHADPGDSAINYDLVTTISYNAFSKEFQKTITQRFHNSATPSIILKDTKTEYNAMLAISAETVSSRNDINLEMDTVKRTYTFDIFGNRHSYTKVTTYADGRAFTHKGPVDIYNANNLLVLHRNQLGHEERYTHDQSGRLVKISRPDGSEISYSYDAAGQVTQTRTGTASETVDYTYSSLGRLSRVQRAGDSIEYAYNLDGTCRSVSFVGGLKQEYTFDQFSRMVQEKDVFGVTRDYKYNPQGQLSQRSCNGDTLLYTYGSANYTNGLLLSTKLTGGQTYERTVTYDGFGRTSKVKFINRNSENILNTSILYSPRGQIGQITSTSYTHNHKDLKQRREFSYDGCGHLIVDSVAYLNDSLTQTVSQILTRYKYDGNSNVISTDINGTVKNSTYNAIDQRIDPGFSYDRLGRLLTDDTGRRYSFDNSDRLTSVANPSKPTSSFVYRSDDSLSHYSSDTKNTDIYFSQRRINAMRIKESPQSSGSNTSLLSESGRLVAAYQPSESSATYFVDSQGSNVIAFDKKAEAEASVQTYKAYGAPSEHTFQKLHSSFGFKQEFTDPNSGLIYLRARYYSPDSMSFISPDTIHKENRYAYCAGDPVNYIDPTGNSREAAATAAGLAVGLIIGILISTLSAGALTPIGTALGVEFGATTTAIITGIISGAAGNIAGGVTAALIKGEEYTPVRALLDGITGAIGGSASNIMAPMVGPVVGPIFNTIANNGLPVQVLELLPMKTFTNWIISGVSTAITQGPKQHWQFILSIPVNHYENLNRSAKLATGAHNSSADNTKSLQGKFIGNMPRQTEKLETNYMEEESNSLMRGLLPDSANWINEALPNLGAGTAMPISSQESFSSKELGLGYGGALKFYGGMRI